MRDSVRGAGRDGRGQAGDNWGAEYAVSLDLYNGKEIPVGLRDITVVITHDAGEERSRPWDETSRRFSGYMSTYDTLTLVNLAPRQWVHLELLGNLDGAKTAKIWRRIEFVAERRGLFGVRSFTKTLDSRPPFSDPFAR